MTDRFDPCGPYGLEPLDPASRALLDSAREGLTPDARAIGRVRGRLDTALAVGSGTVLATVFASKLVIAGVAAVAIGAAYLAHDRQVASEPIASVDPPATGAEVAPVRRTAREPEVAPSSTARVREPIAMPPMDVSSRRGRSAGGPAGSTNGVAA